MNVIHVGPLILDATLLALVVAAVLGNLAIRTTLKQSGKGLEQSERLLNTFVIGFFIWKLSFILFDFNTFINYPMSVVYFDGGMWGAFLAVVISALYLWRHLSLTEVGTTASLLFIGWIAGSVGFFAITAYANEYLRGYYIVLTLLHLLLYVMMQLRMFERISLVTVMQVYFIMSIGWNFMNEERSYVIFSFSWMQIIGFMLLLLITIFDHFNINKQRALEEKP